MNINEIIKKYHTDLDKDDKSMIDKKVAEKGIEEYLNQQLIYLDCSRVINEMRMMQTIGYPYKREISSYVYALDTSEFQDKREISIWIDKLIERHQANLKYEKENPPIRYGGKSKKNTTRERKVEKADMFPEEIKKAKISKAEAKLKAKLLGSNISFGSFKIKKD